MISWLFEIGTNNLSTKDVTWNSTFYTAAVIPDSFSGIKMRWDISGNGLIAPNDMSFDISNSDGAYTASSFEGEFCTVRLIIDDVETRTWKFKIKRAVSYYGKISCSCVDFLQDNLKGDWPNTPAPKELWPSDDVDEEDIGKGDNYCVPVVLGEAYIPVRSVNTGTDRYYILGESGPTYTVDEVRSPRAWPNSSTWTSASYTMTLSTDSGYQLLQPIIADSDGDGTADATGVWRSGDTFYDMLCKYYRSDTSSYTNPAQWIEYVLESFGVASGDIDSTSFSAANSIYSSQGITFNGGFWRKENRERILANLLAQVDSYLACTDQVKLYQFDTTSQETITNAMLRSFRAAPISRHDNDSGRVHWPESDKPQDKLTGQKIVPSESGGTTDNPSADVLKCRFLAGQSQNAQKAGTLYFNKKYGQTQRFSFSATLTSLVNSGSITPGQVVTVDNILYGGTNDVVITEMGIQRNLRVDFTGVLI